MCTVAWSWAANSPVRSTGTSRIPRVWLLDEVSGVTGWTSVLKLALDNTAFGGDTVIATGSRWAADEDIEGNLLAGRPGTSPGRRTRLLLPMTFRNYLAASRPELARPAPVHVSDLQDPSTADVLDSVAFDLDGYDLAWQDYLTCGGFPRAVAEHTRTGAVSTAYLSDLRSWLRADVDPDRPQDSVPRLLDGISQRSTSPLNITAASTALGYPSLDIFVRRLNRLVSSHAAIWCPRREGEHMVAGAQAKLYLTDPLLATLPSRLRPAGPDMTRLTEMTIGVALARAVDDLEEGHWVTGDTIGYARTSGDREVDLGPVTVPSANGPVTTVPLESKWVEQGWKGEARTIDAKFGRASSPPSQSWTPQEASGPCRPPCWCSCSSKFSEPKLARGQSPQFNALEIPRGISCRARARWATFI
jgi:predicted AAA+ superfamily ATPase